ncbi:MAG: hypothetical protein ABEK50_06380 [bacterium]
MELLFLPTIRNLVLLVHVSCAMFWLAWMVFFSLILTPILYQVVPGKFQELRAIFQRRTRQLTKPLIATLVLTGVYNMAANGFWNFRKLLLTEHGLWFVVKLFFAVLLIGLYFLAPDFSQINQNRQNNTDAKRQWHISLYVHGVILLLGMTRAYIGISL